jgi:phosphoribosylglycinamide formyltransferase 1
MKNIVIFASGSGTNAERLIEYFKSNPEIRVKAVFTNNPKAGVIDKARKYFLPVYLFSKMDLQSEVVLNELKKLNTDLIILAGFLWMIPEHIISSFNDKIVNIHPSLLPKFGGSGMYGNKVHKAVIEAKEKESGISIHLVNNEYDKGTILFQVKTTIAENETAETLAAKVHELELTYFPKVVEYYINSRLKL